MAQDGDKQDTSEQQPEQTVSSSAAAHSAHGADEPPADPLAGLSSSGRELLGITMDVLKEFSPSADALDDLPQVKIDRRHVLAACRAMKEDHRINGQMLLCLACVDFSDYFQLIYILQSLNPEQTVVIRTDVPYSDATVSSVTSVWQAADWYEREAHDLFGVGFDGHPDLSPLLLYDGFEGFPGRKEFPFNEYQEF